MDLNAKRRPHVQSIYGLRRRLALQWQPKNESKRQQHFATFRTDCYLLRRKWRTESAHFELEAYAVLARRDEVSDDDSISELENSSEEDFDELHYSIFDIPGDYVIVVP